MPQSNLLFIQPDQWILDSCPLMSLMKNGLHKYIDAERSAVGEMSLMELKGQQQTVIMNLDP